MLRNIWSCFCTVHPFCTVLVLPSVCQAPGNRGCYSTQEIYEPKNYCKVCWKGTYLDVRTFICLYLLLAYLLTSSTPAWKTIYFYFLLVNIPRQEIVRRCLVHAHASIWHTTVHKSLWWDSNYYFSVQYADNSNTKLLSKMSNIYITFIFYIFEMCPKIIWNQALAYVSVYDILTHDYSNNQFWVKCHILIYDFHLIRFFGECLNVGSRTLNISNPYISNTPITFLAAPLRTYELKEQNQN